VFLINDDNYKKLCKISKSSIELSAGRYSTGWWGRKFPSGEFFKPVSEVIKLIPRAEWPDRIRDGQGTFLSDLHKQFNIKVKNQNGLNYCWAYGSTSTIELSITKTTGVYLDLSPESVAGPIVRWRNIGGYVEDACKQLLTFGACLSSFMNAPNSLTPSKWITGWENNCLKHRIDIDFRDVMTFDELITLLFERVPVAVGYNWWGHLVCACDPVLLPDNSVGVRILNSWYNKDGTPWGDGGFANLTESLGSPDGAFAPLMVLPSTS
jgi:hypothetical protein